MNIRTLFVKYINLRNKLDQAKIYKIIDNTNGKIYIGSTCKTLKHRLSGHERDYKRFLKGIYNNVSSFDIIKNDDYKIELIENCDIKTKQQLLSRERYFIDNNNCLNKVIPGRSHKEYCKLYRETNKDKIQEYRDTNKDKTNKKYKVYYQDNKDKLSKKIYCECGGQYTKCHKLQHSKTNKHQDYLKTSV